MFSAHHSTWYIMLGGDDFCDDNHGDNDNDWMVTTR